MEGHGLSGHLLGEHVLGSAARVSRITARALRPSAASLDRRRAAGADVADLGQIGMEAMALLFEIGKVGAERRGGS